MKPQITHAEAEELLEPLYAAPITAPDVAELQAQLERYKAVMDELLDAVNEAMYSNTTDEAKSRAFKALEQLMLTQERLKEFLHYDPETGIFTQTEGAKK